MGKYTDWAQAKAAEIAGKDRLISELSAARDRLRAFINTPDWGGAGLGNGDFGRVRVSFRSAYVYMHTGAHQGAAALTLECDVLGGTA